MRLVIVDTNTWAAVFKEDSADHAEFQDVLEAIRGGVRRLAWGGSRYREELIRCYNMLKLHFELSKAGMAIACCDEHIDRLQAELIKLESHPDFDDSHIIALEIVSKAGVIVSKDKRAHPFFKKKELYPKGYTRPKIYTGKRHKTLLS